MKIPAILSWRFRDQDCYVRTAGAPYAFFGWSKTRKSDTNACVLICMKNDLKTIRYALLKNRQAGCLSKVIVLEKLVDISF